jgi:hypothetical protein
MRTVRAVCLSVAVALPVLAQQPQGTATTQNAPPRVEEPAITFSFAGGTLQAFVEQLRLGTPGLNIVAPELAKDIELPKFEFQHAPLLDALQSVALVAPAGYHIDAVRSSSTGGSPVYTLRVQLIGGPMNQGPTG